MTTFDFGTPVTGTGANLDPVVELTKARDKILAAMAAGASVVKSIEVRGRIIQHTDLAKELDEIERLIKLYEDRAAGKSHLKPARTRAKLRR